MSYETDLADCERALRYAIQERNQVQVDRHRLRLSADPVELETSRQLAERLGELNQSVRTLFAQYGAIQEALRCRAIEEALKHPPSQPPRAA